MDEWQAKLRANYEEEQVRQSEMTKKQMAKFLHNQNIIRKKALWNMTAAEKERESLKKLTEMRTIKTNYEMEALRRDGFIPGHIDDNIFEIYNQKRTA